MATRPTNSLNAAGIKVGLTTRSRFCEMAHLEKGELSHVRISRSNSNPLGDSGVGRGMENALEKAMSTCVDPSNSTERERDFTQCHSQEYAGILTILSFPAAAIRHEY